MIQRDLEAHNDFFKHKPEACGKVGGTSLQKMTAALRRLCYGVSADAIDEYVRLGKSTIMKSMYERVLPEYS
jgi:hypothetical protein